MKRQWNWGKNCALFAFIGRKIINRNTDWIFWAFTGRWIQGGKCVFLLIIVKVMTIVQTCRFCLYMMFVYFVNNNTMRTALSTFEFVTVYIHSDCQKFSKSKSTSSCNRNSLSLMLCAPVFIFSSDSSAPLGRPRGLSVWLSLLAIFNKLFWVYVKFFTRKRTKQENTSSPPFLYDTKMAIDVYEARKALMLRELL